MSAADRAGAAPRIQKVLADAGVASRRAVEVMIEAGRIKVNGDPATLGQRIEAGDRITVDGKPVRHSAAREPTRVLLYKKRSGELVTRDDPEGRKTVFAKLPALASGRWIAVGRLDLNTSGLLLLTNDGELARRLTHPSYQISREYAVRVLGEMTADKRARLCKGVDLDDGPAHFDRIEPGDHEDGEGANQWWRVSLREGRNREVRRMFESLDLQVSRLIRVRYGPIELGRGVRSGGWRDLSEDELFALRKAVGLIEKTRPRRARPGRTERDEEAAQPATPRRDARKPVQRYAKPDGWQGYRPRKPGSRG